MQARVIMMSCDDHHASAHFRNRPTEPLSVLRSAGARRAAPRAEGGEGKGRETAEVGYGDRRVMVARSRFITSPDTWVTRRQQTSSSESEDSRSMRTGSRISSPRHSGILTWERDGLLFFIPHDLRGWLLTPLFYMM